MPERDMPASAPESAPYTTVDEMQPYQCAAADVQGLMSVALQEAQAGMEAAAAKSALSEHIARLGWLPAGKGPADAHSMLGAFQCNNFCIGM